MASIVSDKEMVCNICHQRGSFAEFHAELGPNKGRVNAPDDALVELTESLYDAADPHSAVRVTAHQVGMDAAYNIWMCHGGDWVKLIEERVIADDEPVMEGIAGELLRLATDPQMGPFVEKSFRLKQAAMSLSARANQQASSTNAQPASS